MAETTRSGNLGVSANGQARQASPLDYTAIFGALSSCSIPVLDLPPVEDDLDFRRCSVADYPEIFGGDDDRDFAVSFEELLAFNDSSGIRVDDVSDRDFRGGKLQAGSSSKSSDASTDDKTAQMNMLDDFSEFIIKQNLMNEVKSQSSPSNFHDAAPADDKKTEMNGHDCASKTKIKQNLADEGKITNHTPTDHNFDTPIKGCDLTGSSSDDQHHLGSSSLGKSSPSKTSDPDILGNSMEKKVNMNPQITQSEDLTGNKEETKEFMHSVEDLSFDQKSTESPLRSISPSSDTYKVYDQVREFHHSRSSSAASLSSLDRMLSSDSFLKVTDISLRTKPLKVPPPRRAPPARPPPLDAEASVAAMKKAMEVAQARLRSAKASLEKKREGLQNQKRESGPEKGRGREEESGEWKVEEEFYEFMKIPKVDEEKSKEREGNQLGKLETKWRASKEAFICEVGDNGALRKLKTSKSSEKMKRTLEREASCEVDVKGDGEERRRSNDGEFVHLENQKVLVEAERVRRKLEKERERRRLEEERERVTKLREDDEESEKRLKEKVSREREEAERRKTEEKEKEERERRLKEEEEREKERLRTLREKEEAQRRKTEEEERERRRLEEERQSVWRLQKEEEERERRLKEEVEREKEKRRLLKEEEEARKRITEEKEREKRRLEEERQRAWRLQKEEEERERRLKEEVEREKEKLRLLREKEDAERRKTEEEEKERKRLERERERERKLQEEDMERQRTLHEEEEREREDEERARRELREREEREGSNLKVSDEVGTKSEERVRGKWRIEEERMKFRKMESMMDRQEKQRDKWRTEKGKEIEADEDERERRKQEEQREREQEREKDRLAAERAARETNERVAMEKSFSKLKTDKSVQEGKPASTPGLGVSESGETPIRSRARMERHQRTVERAAKALAEKNLRDVIAQREQAERNRLAESLDAEIRRWSNGKEGNLRALLSTLQYILGSESGWHPVPLTEVLTPQGVKRAYRKATLCVHPDKLQQRGASIQHKYICEKVFDLLKEAWSRFNSEER